MIDQSEFLEKYRVDEEAFKSSGIKWEELVNIYSDYEGTRNELEPTGDYIANRLRQLTAVHSLRIRLKEPEHLIEKIIRKKIEDNTINVNQKNYKDKVTDLIGVRALHLFKKDWVLIHNFITSNWDFHEKPTANVRKGDTEDVIKIFQDEGCTINEHKFGYRSVHYIVKSKPAKNLHLAEIQVRTIFEEGFSEIDHRIRYPYDLDNVILAYFLAIFNRLAGSADEMGSFVKILKYELDKYAHEREELAQKLKEEVTKLEIAENEKEKLQTDLDNFSFIKSPILESAMITPQTFNYAVPELKLGSYTSKFAPIGRIARDMLTLTTLAADEDQKTIGKKKKKPSKKDKT